MDGCVTWDATEKVAPRDDGRLIFPFVLSLLSVYPDRGPDTGTLCSWLLYIPYATNPLFDCFYLVYCPFTPMGYTDYRNSESQRKPI
jgi:hypothetical protein